MAKKWLVFFVEADAEQPSRHIADAAYAALNRVSDGAMRLEVVYQLRTAQEALEKAELAVQANAVDYDPGPTAKDKPRPKLGVVIDLNARRQRHQSADEPTPEG